VVALAGSTASRGHGVKHRAGGAGGGSGDTGAGEESRRQEGRRGSPGMEWSEDSVRGGGGNSRLVGGGRGFSQKHPGDACKSDTYIEFLLLGVEIKFSVRAFVQIF
jgi:hypothetical protein